ncbi:hypothetical protein Scep_015439 [Stephania cephalantha]|uniref:Exostosin GT47 domain-containing protein n=1 Tax=Stephania cephalantha TaxID=152367 RepID=A0AAP0P1D1_9MAGN
MNAISPQNRGFFIKMKIVKSKRPIRPFFHKSLKWVFWVSISLYVSTSLLINHVPNTKPTSNNTHHHQLLPTNPKTRSSRFVPRALFESTPQKPLQKPKPTINLDLKIYIYELPEQYNSDWLSNDRCSTHLFASEVAIHRALMRSEVRTLDPYEADFFFVPVYLNCNFSTENGFPSTHQSRRLISSAVRFVSSNMPFWNRSDGADHVFVASHDYGPCFHSIEGDAIRDGIPEVLRKSIFLQTFGVTFRHTCQEAEHVLIPPYVPPGSLRSTEEGFPVDGKRVIPAFFRGKVEVHPKNFSGRVYSKGVRTTIWRKFKRNRKFFYLRRHRIEDYQSEIRRSVFCLCPLGWAPWSPRLVESVALGCVPVIIADGIRLPFSETVRWPEISLTVAERDVGKLGRILRHVANTNLTTIQRNLWDPAKTGALLFNDRVESGDATWHVIRSLRERLIHRSYRRTLISANEHVTRQTD